MTKSSLGRHKLSLGPVTLLASSILQHHTTSKAGLHPFSTPELRGFKPDFKFGEFFLTKCIQQWGKKKNLLALPITLSITCL